jgi:hypothetical protein
VTLHWQSWPPSVNLAQTSATLLFPGIFTGQPFSERAGVLDQYFHVALLGDITKWG